MAQWTWNVIIIWSTIVETAVAQWLRASPSNREVPDSILIADEVANEFASLRASKYTLSRRYQTTVISHGVFQNKKQIDLVTMNKTKSREASRITVRLTGRGARAARTVGSAHGHLAHTHVTDDCPKERGCDNENDIVS
ncbi:hypothetical protein EVAR_7227_1 [Eumeta japonica]|uniref:Uncharacterized protein n=1 Tax=Eumeta variegata TaxID=151549 RepID=A0A4C1T2C4_EUMVA|nr:hypothetical protein EVAR_7227_1 [Eumeta japonica]